MSQSPHNRDDHAAGAPPKTNAIQAKRASLRDRKVTVTLSLPKAIFSVFFSLFVLIWVFIFGVMLGRGHNPEDVVPELAKVMPAPSAPSNTPADENINDVLKPQDLKYHDTLKSKDPVEKPRAPAPVQQAAQPQPAAPAKPQTPPPAAHKPAQQAPAPKPAPTTSPAPAAQKGDQDKTVYNYVYQVAAFNNATAAQTMQKKLQDGGVSTKIAQTESGSTVWYRLLVSFKGKPEDTRELREKLAPYGISGIILRGKTPAK